MERARVNGLVDPGRVVGWAGVFPAAMTMFSKSGDLDEESTGRHLENLIGNGAHGLVVAGTSGEFIGLTEAERRRLIAVAVSVVNHRVPLIVGTGYFSTRETIRLTEFAAAQGADGAIVILPYYQRPSPAEVAQHYRMIAQAVRLPIMLYNNAGNSGAPAIDAVGIRALFEEGALSAGKSTAATVHEIHELAPRGSGDLKVFYGSFMAPLEAMAGGADGWISGILNVVLPDAISLWSAMQAQDLTLARRVWGRILQIRNIYTRQQVGSVSDLAIYRAILNLRGAKGGYCRPPLLDLTAEQYGLLEAILTEAEIGPNTTIGGVNRPNIATEPAIAPLSASRSALP